MKSQRDSAPDVYADAMHPPNDQAGTWEGSWLAAMTVIKSAQRVFTPENRPPSELIPLVEPLSRLGDALRATPPDPEESRRRHVVSPPTHGQPVFAPAQGRQAPASLPCRHANAGLP